mmetsp:Transcript_25724/g.53772  ORF Transcript_25724/g.53772 Transcript_25724/m.53772 type:complete len:160 (-) Transcript_25724:159-638(-)
MEARSSKQVRFSEFASLAVYNRQDYDQIESWCTERERACYKIAVHNEVHALREKLVAHELEKLAYSCYKFDQSDMSIRRRQFLIDVDEAEIRGVEHLLSSRVSNLAVRRRKALVSHVIQEQKIQKILGIRNDLRLAEISRKYSDFSKEWSYNIAVARCP